MPTFFTRLFKRKNKSGQAGLNRSTDSSQISHACSFAFTNNDEPAPITCSGRHHDGHHVSNSDPSSDSHSGDSASSSSSCD
ncbi:hypothetical protein B2J77_10420 [Pseudomonas parafulva]|uniref:Uncharacterized protein n=1 Tax=Pseudomonas parafulva TaxID=157782 RepID=A0ABM6J2K3_9PSED|nr:hypothetical protein B2J77_10420 [Pseudomonas parafulva]